MRSSFRLFVVTFLLGLILAPLSAGAASKAEIERNARAALATLYEKTPAARQLSEKAKAVLVFPGIIKGGLIWGGQTGNGAMFKDGVVTGYYNTSSISYGLQAGIQEYGYAMFFMNDAALAYLDKSKGFEVGAGPSVVVLDSESVGAFGKNMTTTTLKDDIYAFIFSQKGLMAGLGLQGSKITKINPGP